MSERRFFVDRIDEITVVSDEEFRHAAHVLRIKKGDGVLLCDNTRYEYRGEVLSVDKNSFSVKIAERRENDREAKTDVTLLCGYLKGDKTEYSVQKAVELGVKRVVVFRSEFCSAYMNENKLARLNKVAAEAAKQCGRSVQPKVEYYDDFAAALAAADAENKLFACEFASETTCDMSRLKGATAVVVGSEGGFSEEEARRARELGYETLYLGKRILRADTAAVTALSVVMWQLGELQ